ncbi:MAG TPA: hypothetical protein VFI14_01845 [Chryseosolibacter sp.]|nr:hypothetical protein [Chryseosolibacter sp.]
MNKTSAIVLAIFSSTFCFSQDIITTRSGDDIEAKVLKVGLTEVEYKRFDNPDGPLFSILKSEVLLIRYENGTKDVFEVEPEDAITAPKDLYIRGQSDALTYYDGYKGAGTGTLITSLLSPLVGLVPAVACSSTPPREINLNYPDQELMAQPEYSRGYRQRAKKIKQGKVWTNWGIALGINFVLVLLIVTGQ